MQLYRFGKLNMPIKLMQSFVSRFCITLHAEIYLHTKNRSQPKENEIFQLDNTPFYIKKNQNQNKLGKSFQRPERGLYFHFIFHKSFFLV